MWPWTVQKQFDLRPHDGAGPVSFGMSQDAAEKAMATHGLARTYRFEDYDTYDNVVRLEFTTEDSLSFIEFAPRENVTVLYRGSRVDSVPARKVVELFSAGERHPPAFDAHEILFPDQILTLWHADTQYSRWGQTTVWGRIGIGSAEYLDAVDDLAIR